MNDELKLLLSLSTAPRDIKDIASEVYEDDKFQNEMSLQYRTINIRDKITSLKKKGWEIIKYGNNEYFIVPLHLYLLKAAFCLNKKGESFLGNVHQHELTPTHLAGAIYEKIKEETAALKS